MKTQSKQASVNSSVYDRRDGGLAQRRPNIWREAVELISDEGVLGRIGRMNARVAKEVIATLKTVRDLGWFGNQRALDTEASNLVNLALGDTQDLRGLIMGRIPRHIIKSQALKIIKARKFGDSRTTKILQSVELEQSGKFGPKSTVFGWEKLKGEEKVTDVFTESKISPEVAISQLKVTVDIIKKFLPHQSIELTPLEDVLKDVDKTAPHDIGGLSLDTSKSSGYPYMARKFKPSDDQDPRDRKQSELAFNNLVNDYNRLWPIAYSGKMIRRLNCRTHLRKTSVGSNPEKQTKKGRLVIAVEKVEAVIGKRYVGPEQQALKDVTFRLGQDGKFVYNEKGGIRPFDAWYDLPYIDITQQKFLHLAAQNKWTCVSGDVSGFDASLPAKLIWTVGELDAYWCRAGKVPLVMSKAMTDRLNLVTPKGIRKNKNGSMPSGSVHTNKTDSLALSIVLIYGHVIGLYKLSAYEVNGDDFVAVGENVTPDTISQVFNLFNLEVHPEKQFYEEGMLAYLQRIHMYGYIGGQASVMRVLNSITSYERRKVKSREWNPHAEVVRVLAQLENAAFSPWFEDIVEYVKKRDRLKLGADMHPKELMDEAGKTGLNAMSQDVIGAWQSFGRPDRFSQWAVNGVLRGEKLPPLGSKQRFERVYGDRIDPFREEYEQLNFLN
jgi:hypothetical protein